MEAVKDEKKGLEQQIKELEENIYSVDRQIKHIDEELEMDTKNKQFVIDVRNAQIDDINSNTA